MDYLQHFLILVFSGLLYLIGHIFFCRFLGHSLIKSLFAGYLLGLFILVLTTFMMNFSLTLLLANLLIYSCFAYCIFHIAHIPEASVRIRILRELQDHGALSQSQILEKYNAEMILLSRIDRLTQTQQIVKRGDMFFNLKPKILIVAKIFRLFKRMLYGSRL